MINFHQTQNNSIYLNPKRVQECHMSYMVESLKILTYKNYTICMFKWEGWWKCLRMLLLLKILEPITITTLSFLRHSSKP
jgi:hypothetical protein